MSTIIKLKTSKGEDRFKVRIKKKGYRITYTTFKTIEAAENFAKQVEEEIDKNRIKQKKEDFLKSENDLNTEIEKYITYVLSCKSPQMVKDQMRQLRFWQKIIGGYKPSDINKPLVRDIIHKYFMAENDYFRKKVVTKATTKRYIAAISHVFSHLIKQNLYDKQNPFFGLSL